MSSLDLNWHQWGSSLSQANQTVVQGITKMCMPASCEYHADLPLTQAFSRDTKLISWKFPLLLQVLHMKCCMCPGACTLDVLQPAEVGNCCIFPTNVHLFTCLLINFLMVYLTLLPVAQTLKVKKCKVVHLIENLGFQTLSIVRIRNY
jgi:hypothetical protein